jgi:hypothetical protein
MQPLDQKIYKGDLNTPEAKNVPKAHKPLFLRLRSGLALILAINISFSY